MIHALRISYFTLIAYFLLCNVDLYAKGSWWNQEVTFSDWRNVKCDYATNVVVYWWYNGKGKQKNFRMENVKEINNRLAKGDTITVAFDYYAFSASFVFVPIKTLVRYEKELLQGRVMIARVYRVGKTDYWKTN